MTLDRGAIKLAYDRAVAHDTPDVADLLETLAAALDAAEKRAKTMEERRCEVCGYAEHHREHTGCLRVKVKELEKQRDELLEVLEFIKRGMESGHIKSAHFIDFSNPNAEQVELRHPIEIVGKAIANVKGETK